MWETTGKHLHMYNYNRLGVNIIYIIAVENSCLMLPALNTE